MEKYCFEFKLHVIELYLTTESTYQELAFQFGITNPAQIARWVIDYRDSGIDVLRPKHQGRKKSMDKEKIVIRKLRPIQQSSSIMSLMKKEKFQLKNCT